jgi:hypothetical protein
LDEVVLDGEVAVRVVIPKSSRLFNPATATSGGMMDTKTLVVGQDVYLESGVYGLDGKAVKVTPEGVEVQTYGCISQGISSHLLRFDNEGKYIEDVPWYLCPLPAEGGTPCIDTLTEREQAMQRHQPFIAWWKTATYKQRLALVTKYYTTRLAPPPLRSNFAPAEDVAKIADISSDRLTMVELAKEAFI